MLEHLRGLVENVLDPRSSQSTRARHARTAAETMADLRDAYRAGQATLNVGRVADMASMGPDADLRELQRRQLAELRDLVSYPGLFGTPVVMDGSTGYGPAPLIREAATAWADGLTGGATPVVPGMPTNGPYAEVDPDLPRDDDGPDVDVMINDVGTAGGVHLSIFTGGMSRQVVDFTTPAGRALLDGIVLDDVDAVADAFVAGELITAAAGTRAAGADLAAALDDAEGDAGARGVPQWLIVAPETWPRVRRALAPTWADGPRPQLHVSAGQPAGTVTVVGRGAVLLMAGDYIRMDEVVPRTLGRTVAIARPFYLQVREAAGIQTVTGVS
jgi:hypothetical protein